MDEEQGPRPIRVVLAAPFPEIVGLHERIAEYADRLDICGAVMDADSAVDQARVLGPDVLLVSNQLLGADTIPGRLAAAAPAASMVVVHSPDGPDITGARAKVAATATGGELHDTLSRLAAAGSANLDDQGQAGPDDTGDDVPTWFWESRRSRPGPSVSTTPATAEQADSHGPSAAGERPSWPPPWFRVAAADEEAQRQATGDHETEPASAPSAAETPAPADPARQLSSPAGEAAVPAGATPYPDVDPAPLETGDAPPAVAAPQPPWSTRERPASSPSAPYLPAAAPEGGPATFPDPTPAAATPEDDPASPDAETGDGETPAGTLQGVDVTSAPPLGTDVPPAPAQPAVTDTVAEAPPTPYPPAPTPRQRRTSGRAETVLVFSGKGGVGTSVVATNLAVALARSGSSVAVVDLNLQYGDVAVMLHLEGHSATIEALAQHGDQLDHELLEDVLAPGPEGLRALLAPSSPEFADLVTAASLRAVFRELGRSFDYVIIDSASHLEELVLEVMEISDRILVVTAYSIASVKDTKVTLKLLQSLGIEQERISVVLNQTRQKVSFPRADIEKSLNFAALVQIPFDARVDDTIDTGAPMTMSQPKSDFSKAITLIADSLTPAEPEPARSDGRNRRFGLRR